MVTTSSSGPSNKEVVYVSSDEEEDATEWLSVLLQTKFWLPCKDHWEEHRGEMRLLCLYCYKVVCPHCTHDEPGHRLLKVRHYVHRSIILIKDMHDHDPHIDVSNIQTYIVNGQKGVHLRPVRRSPRYRPGQVAHRCSNCSVRIRDKLYCSLACKENADISSLGDISETEADRSDRKRRQQSQARSPYTSVVLARPAAQQPIDASPLEDQRDTDVPEPEHGCEQVILDVPKPPSPTPQQPEAPPAPVAADPSSPQQPEEPPAPVVDLHQLANHPVTLRKRPRKMKHPARAPFF